MSAVFVGTFDPGTQPWREHRRDKIGGSDLAAILGLSKWQSAHSLYYERRGDLTPLDDDKPQLTWGNLLEPVIVQHFADQHPEFHVVYAPGAVYAHKDRPWQVCAPDALLYDAAEWEAYSMLRVGNKPNPVGGVEAKTARFPYDWESGPPDYYGVQVQWSEDVFGVPNWFVAALFGGSDYQEFPVPALPAVQEALRESAAQFLDDLDQGRIPPVDGHDSTYQTIRALHPDIDSDEAVEVGELGTEWIAALRAQKAADEAAKEARARIADLMGRAKVATLDGQKIAYRQPGQKGAPPFLKAVGGLLSRAS